MKILQPFDFYKKYKPIKPERLENGGHRFRHLSQAAQLVLDRDQASHSAALKIPTAIAARANSLCQQSASVMTSRACGTRA